MRKHFPFGFYINAFVYGFTFVKNYGMIYQEIYFVKKFTT